MHRRYLEKDICKCKRDILKLSNVHYYGEQKKFVEAIVNNCVRAYVGGRWELILSVNMLPQPFLLVYIDRWSKNAALFSILLSTLLGPENFHTAVDRKEESDDVRVGGRWC